MAISVIATANSIIRPTTIITITFGGNDELLSFVSVSKNNYD